MQNVTESEICQMKKLESALKAAAKGFYVFPLKENSKIPAIKDFANEATRDKKKITGWWTNGFSKSNIGVYTGRFNESEALIATDIDQKEGKMGEDGLIQLELEGVDFPITGETLTPSGGRHLLYRTKESVKQSVEKLAPGIDIRSRGGYVVFGGSSLSNGEYRFIDREIAWASPGLVARCGRPTPKPDSGSERRAYEVNRENAISRARFYLENEAPFAIQGSGGDQATFKVICRVKDFGVMEADCHNLLEESWSWKKCQPEWTVQELETKIRNAYQYGERQQGVDSPEAVFTKITEEPKAKPRGLYGERGRDVEPNFDQQFLVDKYLSPNAMSVVYGESNSGKTFFALDLGMHISLGQQWQTKQVMKGLVIYIAAEGGWGIRKRIKAFRKYHSLEGKDFPFVLVPCPVDLLNPKTHVNELLELIKSFESEYKIKTELVVVDTLARALGSGNENAPNDMGAFVKNIDAIRQSTKAHLMVIHHSGKDVARGARGHSSLRAATDTEIEISSSLSNSCNIAKVKKQRDMEFGPDIGFSLKQVDIGMSPDGQMVHSCVVVPANVSALSDFSKEALDPKSLSGKGLKSLHDVLKWQPQPAPNELDLDEDKFVVSIDEWREAFYKEAYPNKKKSRSWYAAFTRTVEALTEAGYVHKTDVWAWIE